MNNTHSLAHFICCFSFNIVLIRIPDFKFKGYYVVI